MSSRFFIFIIILFGCAISVVAPNSTEAQLEPTGALQVILTPKYPVPNEVVSVKAKAFTFNEDAADFSWIVNGTTVATGKGKKNITFTTGAIGSKTTIIVSAQPTESSERIRSTIVVYPSSIDILWHANTYTPPGYRGKALTTQGALVQFTALPLLTANGVLISRADLTYEWYVNEKLYPKASGRGKGVFSFPFGVSSSVENRIKVRVSDDTGSAIQEKTIRIQNNNRLVRFYELDPLRGPLYNAAITNSIAIASGRETQIIAEPYYYTVPPQSLSFVWRVENTELVSEKGRGHILTYRSDPGSRALQLITVLIKNTLSIFEHGQESFTIHVE